MTGRPIAAAFCALSVLLAGPALAAEAIEHPVMDHGGMDHAGMRHATQPHSSMHQGHAGHDHPPSHDSDLPEAGLLPPPTIAPLTEADRKAAFPALQGHTVHDKYLAWMLLAEQFEYQDAEAGSTFAWDIEGWLGGDIDRLRLRTEGERTAGETDEAELQLLWGHALDPWWELVAGARQDFQPGSPQTWAAVGVQGMPLYRLETEATAFFGEAGQTALRLEASYDVLLTNRLILQPTAEINLHSRDDPPRGVGSGLSDSEVGLRLRYEIVREFGPYVGVSWRKAHGETADFTRADGEDADEVRLVAGVRFWF